MMDEETTERQNRTATLPLTQHHIMVINGTSHAFFFIPRQPQPIFSLLYSARPVERGT